MFDVIVKNGEKVLEMVGDEIYRNSQRLNESFCVFLNEELQARLARSVLIIPGDNENSRNIQKRYLEKSIESRAVKEERRLHVMWSRRFISHLSSLKLSCLIMAKMSLA